MGYFVSRHLSLEGCNIVLMKRFLPLIMFTGLLFGQDLLTTTDGNVIKGKVVDRNSDSVLFHD